MLPASRVLPTRDRRALQRSAPRPAGTGPPCTWPAPPGATGRSAPDRPFAVSRGRFRVLRRGTRRCAAGAAVGPWHGYGPNEASPFSSAAALRSLPGVVLRADLDRIKRELRRWDAWEANALLPEDLRESIDRPRLPRGALDALQRVLTDELARLDGGCSGA